MYRKVDTRLQFEPREREVLAFWKEQGILEKSLAQHPDGPRFTFYDGPPTANGRPHIGHVLTRAIKDIIPRHRVMKGCHVLRKAGWDTHGLPVELEVEKELGINGKPQIEAYGIIPFLEKCKKSVWKYSDEWQRMSERVAYWVDMEHPYVTYHDDYIESEWWAISQIHQKGLLYKGHKVIPYCPRCGTALSSHEVAQGYKDVKETSIFVRFAVKGRPGTYLLAWTTTPWTLPSNVALCVNPKEDYVFARRGGETLILAKGLLPVLGDEAEILQTVPGNGLVGLEYEPLYTYGSEKLDKKAYYVVADTYVSLDAGSGIVHIAPAFGEDDARVGREYNLPLLQLVDAQGRFVPEAEPLTGLFVKEADPVVIKDLDARGLLFARLPYEHSYPFCWRCDTPLIYYARTGWFIRMSALRQELLQNNRTVNWLPENIRDGRMGNFLENVIDWALSRERYWGTPLPVWECECGHFEVLGSRRELCEKTGAPLNTELHKPYLDPLTFPCPKCGRQMRRVPEVIDCWFDSGAMPFAQWHYPFENKEVFLDHFPAQFISEAIDQTRGWFYSLLALSTILFDRSAYENCLVLGHVNDKNGLKMSKHKGNVVDTDTVISAQGADAVRWYFYVSSAPWVPSRFSAEAVAEAARKFMGTLWNTYAFYVLYADIDQFDPTKHPLSTCTLSLLDEWVLSRLNSLVQTVDDNLERYAITEAARAMEQFSDELSNWYVRRSRERFWGPGMEGDKEAAFATLFTCLETLSRLTAPFLPFLSEQIYQNIVRTVTPSAPESVHLCAFPAADKTRINTGLEADMDALLRVVALGRTARAGAVVKNRQPLQRLLVAGRTLTPQFAALALEELNVKEMEYLQEAGEYTGYTVKPQLRTLGPKYGPLLAGISKYLQQADAARVVAEARAGGHTFAVNGNSVTLTEEDLLIAQTNRPGYAAAADAEIAVILDIELTPALVAEGNLRELTSRLQNLRKESGLQVTDHIRLTLGANEELTQMLTANRAALMADVLADALTLANGQGGVTLDINGEPVTVLLEKV